MQLKVGKFKTFICDRVTTKQRKPWSCYANYPSQHKQQITDYINHLRPAYFENLCAEQMFISNKGCKQKLLVNVSYNQIRLPSKILEKFSTDFDFNVTEIRPMILFGLFNKAS